MNTINEHNKNPIVLHYNRNISKSTVEINIGPLIASQLLRDAHPNPNPNGLAA